MARPLEGRWPQAAQPLLAAEGDGLAYPAFPRGHWTRRYSTDLLERLSREDQRRTDVVGGAPDAPAVYRRVGAVLLELDDEGQVERRSCSRAPVRRPFGPEPTAELAPAAPRLAPVRWPPGRQRPPLTVTRKRPMTTVHHLTRR